MALNAHITKDVEPGNGDRDASSHRTSPLAKLKASGKGRFIRKSNSLYRDSPRLRKYSRGIVWAILIASSSAESKRAPISIRDFAC